MALISPAPKPTTSKPATPNPATARAHVRRQAAPEAIEPGRMRRLTRDRDPMGPRLDLHGLDQDQARSALTGFLLRAQDDGWRAVLVITGKGSRGDGILRRFLNGWRQRVCAVSCQASRKPTGGTAARARSMWP